VRGRCEGADLPLGERLQVELVTADPVGRTVLFRPPEPPARMAAWRP
jgi:hypothetical protein